MSDSQIEELKIKIRDDIEAYVISLRILGTLKRHLEKKHLHAYVEIDINRVNGTPKRPDLLVNKNNHFLIMDNKYVRSDNPKTLESALDEVNEYDDNFELKGVNFRPQVAMLCPLDAAQLCEQLTHVTNPVIGYVVEKEIALTKVTGSIIINEIEELCDPSSPILVEEEVKKYKFIRQEAPLPYTAHVVFSILNGFFTDYFQTEFNVSYDIVLEQFNTLFPPWIKNDVIQLTPGRLNASLDFLKKIDWIDWIKEQNSIVVKTNKGGKILDIIKYFIERYASFKIKELKRNEKKKMRQKIINEKMGTRLENFFQE